MSASAQLKVSGDRELPHGSARRPCRALRERELGYTQIAYNSCRIDIPECQGAADTNGLPRTRPTIPVRTSTSCSRCQLKSRIAYHKQAVIYDILLQASAETMITIAADPKHLAARIVSFHLHTWGSALTHHPHVT